VWRNGGHVVSINTLELHEMSAVVFKKDYIQFLFEGEEDDGILTTYNSPITVVNGFKFNQNTYGYRDILCSLINKKVKKSEITGDHEIKIMFENCDELVIPLELDNKTVTEAAMLRVKDYITVW
jgi:hypothetical protein